VRDGPKLVLPLRVGALLTLSPTVRVRVSAKADALEIRAPFGDLTVPYAMVTRVARDEIGEIRLDLSGVTLRLDCSGVPPMALNALFDLLEGKGKHPKPAYVDGQLSP
jgi:hypothetical protein